ncbi:hypothetical protein N9L90_04045 [Planctomycetota bacterium]|nr:hypothetical protein [Planctomycetota bacterium]
MPLLVRAAILAFACLTAFVALDVRRENAIGVALDAAPSSDGAPAGALSWGSYDPDTLYHARRVARAVENAGWVSSFDPLLAYPEGAGPDSLGTAIPWPPAYDLLLTAMARGRAPSIEALLPSAAGDPVGQPQGASEPLLPATRRRIEQLVASAPMWWGALTALIAALAAAGLASTLVPSTRAGITAVAAALIAGLTVAFTFGHVRYSHLGNGDHHAFISLLHVAMLAVVGASLRPDRIAKPVGSAARGGAAGLLAGVMITSWTASILWVALVQLALVLRLALPFRGEQGRQSARGLPILATTFHKAALLVVMPAAIESPFSSTDPFSLIELSWFHMAWLAIGWLIFAPYALLPRFAAKRRVAATFPALALGLALLVGTDIGARLLEAFSWAGAENPFMGGDQRVPAAGGVTAQAAQVRRRGGRPRSGGVGPGAQASGRRAAVFALAHHAPGPPPLRAAPAALRGGPRASDGGAPGDLRRRRGPESDRSTSAPHGRHRGPGAPRDRSEPGHPGQHARPRAGGGPRAGPVRDVHRYGPSPAGPGRPARDAARRC